MFEKWRTYIKLIDISINEVLGNSKFPESLKLSDKVPVYKTGLHK